MAKKTQLQKIESMLGGLSLAALHDLRTTLDQLIAVLEAQEESQQQEAEQGEKRGPGRGRAGGYIEKKMINGYGPYLYLRWWQGKTHKSKYLGKAEDSAAGG